MWPQDQGLLIPHQVVLRLQLVKKGKGMNGLGLPAGKGAQRDKSCPLEWFHSQTLGIFTGKVKSPGVPLVSSPPHHSELHSAGQGPSLGPGSTNYLMEMGMQPPQAIPRTPAKVSLSSDQPSGTLWGLSCRGGRCCGQQAGMSPHTALWDLLFMLTYSRGDVQACSKPSSQGI